MITPHQLADAVGLLFKPLTYEFQIGDLKFDLLDVLIIVGFVGLLGVGMSNFEAKGVIDSLF